MQRSESIFKRDILPIIKSTIRYSEKVDEIRKEIQVYAQTKLHGKYNPKLHLCKGSLGQLKDDRYYNRLEFRLKKVNELFSYYSNLFNTEVAKYQKQFGLKLYNKYFDKYVKKVY